MLNNHHESVNEDENVRSPSSNRMIIDNDNSYEKIVFKKESDEMNYKDILCSDEDMVVTDKTQSDYDNKLVTLTMHYAFSGSRCASGFAKINGICAEIDY